MYSEIFLNTISLASRLHRDQFRYDKFKTPYITHLVGVGFLLSSVTKDENIIKAGIMHDSLEDVPEYDYEDLVLDCGTVVADMVLDVTEEKSLPYMERKQKYIDHLKSASIDSIIISVADKYYNLLSYKDMDEERKHDGHMMVIRAVLNIAKERIDKDHDYYSLVDILDKEIVKYN
jgi:(p)ppGpp synthase/HD superfamily hydrolase